MRTVSLSAFAIAGIAGFAWLLMDQLPQTAGAAYATDGRSVSIAGRKMRCGKTPVIMDADIPSEGLSVPGEGLYLNPFLLNRLPAAVQQFIFEHECAHEVTGPDELGADCVAAQEGARAGWLKRQDLDSICESFAGPATDTHPSGKVRCANLKQCFAGSNGTRQELARHSGAMTSSWPSPDATALYDDEPDAPYDYYME